MVQFLGFSIFDASATANCHFRYREDEFQIACTVEGSRSQVLALDEICAVETFDLIFTFERRYNS